MIVFNRTVENIEEVEEIIPKWKISLEKQLSKCIRDEYFEELNLKFNNVKNLNKLCKNISKSVLNSVYEEDILKSIDANYNLNMSDEDKLKITRKLKRNFQSKELEFLRYEISDSISRIKKEWLSL